MICIALALISIILPKHRAIFKVAVQVANKGKKVIPEEMIWPVGGVEEPLGTMIGIARAVLTANRVAEEAGRFSFDTDDLTQPAMGLSRDD